MEQTWSISEASRASGISRTSIYRSLKDGRLRDFEVIEDGRRMLRVKGLVEFLRGGAVKPRIDSPWAWNRSEDDAQQEVPAGAVLSNQPECWPGPDDWERFANDWGQWRPDDRLTGDRYWEEVAQLMRNWMIDPPPAITRSTAPSYFMAITDAMAAVDAGFRFDATQWNRASVLTLLAEPISNAWASDLRSMLDAGTVEQELIRRVERALADYEASKLHGGIEQG